MLQAIDPRSLGPIVNAAGPRAHRGAAGAPLARLARRGACGDACVDDGARPRVTSGRYS
jgi:hypothetical protein